MRTAVFIVLAALLTACVDEPSSEITAVPSMTNDALHSGGFLDLVAGEHHTCSTTFERRVYCWGSNQEMELGTAADLELCSGFSCSTRPVLIDGVALAFLGAGENHTCGVPFFGQAFCWGYNGSGQLGNGSGGSGQTSKPQPVLGDIRFSQVVGGDSHSCGLTAQGIAYCWGNNGGGTLGNPDVSVAFSPVEVAGGHRFLALSSGLQHTCGLSWTLKAYCWGDNGVGQFGTGNTTGSQTPVLAAGGGRFVKLDAGGLHTCAIDLAGRASCWGSNALGQLGIGSTESSLNPVYLDTNARFIQIEAGGSHSCGVTRQFRLLCWGQNELGELGSSIAPESCLGRPCSTRPQPVDTDLMFRKATIGIRGNHTCGLTLRHVVYCWGFNNLGQLGNGSRTKSRTPVLVTIP